MFLAYETYEATAFAARSQRGRVYSGAIAVACEEMVIETDANDSKKEEGSTIGHGEWLPL